MLEIFIICFLVVLLYVTSGFIIASIIKRNDLADVIWGPGIFLSALTPFVLNFRNDFFFTLVLGLIFLWSLRIFLHIGLRFVHKKEEDFRYKNWRDTWKWFYTRSFFQVFFLQGFLMILVATSSISLFALGNNFFLPIFLLGVFVALFGLFFEAVGDWQLKKFLDLKSGGIMTSGLWSYTRHPNYFGEVTFWWGIFIICISSLNPTLIAISLISPFTITYLILYISGIPMLEAKYIGNTEFENYKKKTNAFFPWFSKN